MGDTMDPARRISKCAIVILIATGLFVTGMYSAHKDWGIFQATLWVANSAQALVTERANLMGTAPIHFLREARYPGKGVTINETGAGADDYILLAGFFEDDNKARLITRDGTVVNEWRFRASELLPDTGKCREPPMTDWNALTHGAILTAEGDIVTSFESCGTVRLDRCGKVRWVTSAQTHHSPNFLADGGVVIAGGEYVDKTAKDLPWPFSGPYWEDLILKFAPDGKLAMRVAATEMFKKNRMAPVLNSGSAFASRVQGEFHLNDIEELSAKEAPAFPMFTAGDLLLSFRNLNMLVVTDATGTKVKWFRTGPWVRQHDPDFEADGTITVFDNHTDNSLDGSREGGSRILRINPGTKEITTVYGGRDHQRFYTAERGTHQMLPTGGAMITEAQSGRAFEVDRSGRTIWEYVNRWDADRTAWLHDAEVYPSSFFRVKDWSCP